MATAIYLRVSSTSQKLRSQEADLKRWAASEDEPLRWFRDKYTGTTMNRPGWSKLWAAVEAGEINRVVVWRIDRLGRTMSGLTAFFDELIRRKIGLFSLKDSLDLDTASGRLMANVLASVAAYDNEVRYERQTLGIAEAKAKGIVWGGSQAGRVTKRTSAKEKQVLRLHREKTPIAEIARIVSLSRPTIYRILARAS